LYLGRVALCVLRGSISAGLFHRGQNTKDPAARLLKERALPLFGLKSHPSNLRRTSLSANFVGFLCPDPLSEALLSRRTAKDIGSQDDKDRNDKEMTIKN
jgi:hypothetical protein